MSDYPSTTAMADATGRLPLFDPPPSQPRPTSRAAARSIGPRADTLRRRVLEHLLQCGAVGATDRELATALDLDGNTARPRRIELTRSGHVVDSGHTRPSPSGRASTVWVAATAAAKTPLDGQRPPPGD